MVDLDRFKQYNDANGHVAGDTVLQAVASLLAASVRSQDLVARYGGEEFCVVLPDTDVHGAHALMDRIRITAGEAPIAQGVTCSVGVTQWNWTESATEVIDRADMALYAAKQQGRNLVVAFDMTASSP
jgi:diguanylate cyclase (GGDEF)-like protein